MRYITQHSFVRSLLIKFVIPVYFTTYLGNLQLNQVIIEKGIQGRNVGTII